MLDFLINQTKKLGLNNLEAKVYAVLLETSPAGASFIAKKCGLVRSSVYLVLNTLIDKGLVGTTYRNNIKQFTALNLSALQEIVDKEQEKIKEKNEAIEALRTFVKSKAVPEINIPSISFFEGVAGLRVMLFNLLRSAQDGVEMLVVRDADVVKLDWKFILEDKWQKIKEEKGIKTKLLINDAPEEHHRSAFYKKFKDISVKFLPKDASVEKFMFILVGDTVCFLSMEQNNLVGVKISNEHMAKNFSRLFGVMWRKSK